MRFFQGGGGVEVFSIGLRNFRGVEKLLREIKKFQVEKYSGGLRNYHGGLEMFLVVGG